MTMTLIKREDEQQIFSYDEAKDACIKYFDGDGLAPGVFLDKYALQNGNSELVEQTPRDMHHRLAGEVARMDKSKFEHPYSEEFIFSLFNHFKYIVPQGSPMYAIGNNYQIVSTSNCFVVEPPEDSYGGICKADENMAQICKRRGGVGTDISKLRPNKSLTKNASRTSTGIIPFMERYSNTIREVGQEGRRGALMLSISVHHPEIEDFVTIKNDDTRVTGANISVRLSDEFLNAVASDSEVELRWPVDSDSPTISQMVDARKLWDKIIHNAWLRAEPGLLFWDTIIKQSPADCYADLGFRTVSTNPCGEIPMSPDACRLMAMNTFNYVVNPFTDQAEFDYDLFYEHAQIAERFLDNMVDLEIEKIDQIIAKIDADPESVRIKERERELWVDFRKYAVAGRRTGLGITALGDTFAALGIRYGSDESIDVGAHIYKTLKLGAYRASVDMAKELGPFPVWDPELEKDNPFLLRIRDEDPELYADMLKYGRRNIALLTIAPTGSVSMMTQTTSGVEPAYLLSYVRKRKINHSDEEQHYDYIDKMGDKWREYKVYHPKVKMWMNITGKTDIEESPWFGCCADDLDWTKRVELQAAIQKHCDHAISSTVNLPKDATEQDVSAIYETAWKKGCKGITVYRDGCRTGVIAKETMTDQKVDGWKRPKEVTAEVYHPSVKGSQYFVFVGSVGGKPYEVFAGKNGTMPKKHTFAIIKKVKRGHYRAIVDDGEVLMENISQQVTDEEAALSRMVSYSLRHGLSINHMVHQLEKVPGDMMSYSKAIARILKKYIEDGSAVAGEECQNCHSKLIRQEGCVVCTSCGFSKCA